MDDLKLYANNENNLNTLIEKVKTFSDHIGMKFGYDKCAKVNIVKGKVKERANIPDEQAPNIRELETGEVYKYLGIYEEGNIEHKRMKDTIRKEYYRRVRGIMKTELNAKHKIEAVNSLAIPVVEYGFGIIEWTREEIKKLDRKTRKILTINQSLHPRADVDRIYIPRKDGGRGLRMIEQVHEVAILGLAKYIKEKENDYFIKFLKDNQDNTSKNIIKKAEKIEREYTTSSEGDNNRGELKKRIKAYKNEIKEQQKARLMNNWKSKRLHGQYIKGLLERKNTVDISKTFEWLKSSRLKSVTEAYIMAAQDQALRTKNYEKNILKLDVDDKCRLCHSPGENITHIVSGCTQLAKHEYTTRHDKICKYLHYNICLALGMDNNPKQKWYAKEPEPVTTKDEITICYNQQVQTDRTVNANKPDIIIKNRKDRTCTIIDVAVPADMNVEKKEAEKKLKYKDLAIEIERMWNMKVKIVPIVIGALGVVPKSLKDNLQQIPGQLHINKIQECALLGTTYILRKVGI
ncbi:hypothetical protein M8J77_005743 [Diaphorina citri]|nr:hypothetical protein M8J77_005743 [Diaphorina citri]